RASLAVLSMSSSLTLRCISLLFPCYLHGARRGLHSFPTRRSSDLPAVGELVTSLDMAGLSLTLVFLDEELELHWLAPVDTPAFQDRKSTRLNSSHVSISYAVFCLKKKNTSRKIPPPGIGC